TTLVREREAQRVDVEVAGITGKQGATLGDPAQIAILQDIRDAVGGDQVVDLDAVPVQADVQASDPLRAVHDASGPGFRRFRGQVRVGTGQELVRRLAREARARNQALAQLHVVSRNARRGARGAAGNVACTRRAAGIDVGLEAAANAAVEVIDAGSAETFSEGCTDQQVLDRTPHQAELVVGGVAEGAVVRIAAG